MPKPKKIPPDLEPELLKKYGEGWSGQKIADWLLKDHGIEVTSQAVSQHLKRSRQERTEVTKQVVREKLQPQVTADIDVLSEQQRRLRRFARRQYKLAMGNAQPQSLEDLPSQAGDLYLKAEARLTAVTDVKLHYSGADEPDESATGGVMVMPAPDLNG